MVSLYVGSAHHHSLGATGGDQRRQPRLPTPIAQLITHRAEPSRPHLRTFQHLDLNILGNLYAKLSYCPVGIVTVCFISLILKGFFNDLASNSTFQ